MFNGILFNQALFNQLPSGVSAVSGGFQNIVVSVRNQVPSVTISSSRASKAPLVISPKKTRA